MSMFKAVIFDMDGVMFNTEDIFHKVHTELARKRNKEFSLEIKNKIMGKRAHEVAKILAEELQLEETPEEIFKEQNEHYQQLLVSEATSFAGLLELLNFLEKNNIRKAIGTSSLKEWAEVLLEKFKLRERFEYVVTGDMVSKGKPDPEIYLKVISRLALNPSDCLIIEDSLNGVKAGKAAGCFVVAVPNEFTKNQDFSLADMKVRSLDDEKLLRAIVE